MMMMRRCLTCWYHNEYNTATFTWNDDDGRRSGEPILAAIAICEPSERKEWRGWRWMERWWEELENYHLLRVFSFLIFSRSSFRRIQFNNNHTKLMTGRQLLAQSTLFEAEQSSAADNRNVQIALLIPPIPTLENWKNWLSMSRRVSQRRRKKKKCWFCRFSFHFLHSTVSNVCAYLKRRHSNEFILDHLEIYCLVKKSTFSRLLLVNEFSQQRSTCFKCKFKSLVITVPKSRSTGKLKTEKYKQKANTRSNYKFHNRCIHSLSMPFLLCTAHSVPSAMAKKKSTAHISWNGTSVQCRVRWQRAWQRKMEEINKICFR